MSQLKVNTITDEAGTGAPDFTSGLKVNGNSLPTSGPLSNRNLIINGDMRIDQRNGGSALTVDGTTKFPVDRFFVEEGSDAILSAQQVSDAPDGFLTSLKITISTADTSLGATQLGVVGQRVEGQNMQHLNWGSSSAQTVTLSFWAKSSLTGTFGGSFWNSAFDKSYPFTYSISSANTWEYKTVIVEGPTSGTFLTTSGRGVTIGWSLGTGSTYSGTAGSWQSSGLTNATGSVSVVGTANATWQITGVQLEAGDTATPFEHRSYGQELALCQRYYQRYVTNEYVYGRFAICENRSTTKSQAMFDFGQAMRAVPTLQTTGTASDYALYHSEAIIAATALVYDTNPTARVTSIQVSVSSGLLDGGASQFMANNNASSYIAFDAEL